MKNNLLNLFLCFSAFVSFSSICLAQDNAIQISKKWLGNWEGNMLIYKGDSIPTEIKTALHIKETDNPSRWEWTVVYGEGDKKQNRQYELVAINPTKGQYQIDEKNSIVLDAFYANNTFISHFEVAGNIIISTYRLDKLQIRFQNIVAKSELLQVSGGAENSPEVLSQKVVSLQTAVLSKIERQARNK